MVSSKEIEKKAKALDDHAKELREAHRKSESTGSGGFEETFGTIVGLALWALIILVLAKFLLS